MAACEFYVADSALRRAGCPGCASAPSPCHSWHVHCKHCGVRSKNIVRYMRVHPTCPARSAAEGAREQCASGSTAGGHKRPRGAPAQPQRRANGRFVSTNKRSTPRSSKRQRRAAVAPATPAQRALKTPALDQAPARPSSGALDLPAMATQSQALQDSLAAECAQDGAAAALLATHGAGAALAACRRMAQHLSAALGATELLRHRLAVLAAHAHRPHTGAAAEAELLAPNGAELRHSMAVASAVSGASPGLTAAPRDISPASSSSKPAPATTAPGVTWLTPPTAAPSSQAGSEAAAGPPCPVCMEALAPEASFTLPCCGTPLHVTCIAQCVQRARTMRQNCPACLTPLDRDTTAAVQQAAAKAAAVVASARAAALAELA